jgi:hypothetical protein
LRSMALFGRFSLLKSALGIKAQTQGRQRP